MNKAKLLFLFFVFYFNNTKVFSQDTIVLKEVKVHNKAKKPKLKKIVYGKNERRSYINYDTKYPGQNYYLIENFPAGEVMQLELFALNYKEVGAINKVKTKKILFCNPEKHTVNVYEAVEGKNGLSLGKLLSSKEYLLPPDKSRFLFKVSMDLSHLKHYTDKFFIQLVSPVKYPENCKVATDGFNTFKNQEGVYYFFDEKGNFTQKKGFSIQMSLKVLTREY